MSTQQLKFITILTVFLIQGFVLNAQNKVTGKVTGTDGVPIPGVSVIIEGTTIGDSTDFDGLFTITTDFSKNFYFRVRVRYILRRSVYAYIGKNKTQGCFPVFTVIRLLQQVF